MSSCLFLSDVVLDPVVKEIKALMPGNVVDANYEEEIIPKLLSLSDGELANYDVLFIHSDQVFHKKDQGWQRSFCKVVADVSRSVNKPILVSNSFSLSFRQAPLKSSMGSVLDIRGTYNKEFEELSSLANVYVFDLLGLCMKVGSSQFYNYSLGHLYQMPYTKPAIKQIALQFVEQVNFLTSEEKKVIIVDCDNTLWKGIVGEDGVDDIACDKNADGILYYHFQQFLKARKEEGFLLCICSKNNEVDVKDVFDKKNTPLKWDDFILKKINWDDKIKNIADIGRELNLGTDSFIFIDDNLFELNSIRELLPGVSCVHLSVNYTDFLENTERFVFKRKQILSADVEKTKQYETELLRKNEEQLYTSLDEFIKSLDIKLDIRVNDFGDIPRLSQMTGKTNQFNFNKHVFNEDELKAFMDKGRVYSLKVADKYGDYGTVGLIITELNGTEAIMENYLMSCRALGKKIEYDFFDRVIADLSSQGFMLKDIRFTETPKNIPAQTFIKTMNYGSKP